jgi:hypothetical protein
MNRVIYDSIDPSPYTGAKAGTQATAPVEGEVAPFYIP